MVLLVLSFAYLHLSIKVDILGKGNTGQQKRESGIHRNNCKYCLLFVARHDQVFLGL